MCFRSDFVLSDTTSTEDYTNQWFKVERARVQRTGTGLIGAFYFELTALIYVSLYLDLIKLIFKKRADIILI